MEYRVAFDIATEGYKSWTFPSSGLAFVAVGFFFVATRKRLPGWSERNPRASSIFSFFFLGFALLWTSASFIATYSEYLSLKNAVNSGHVSVVEGLVREFKPMPATGHAMEHFCVQEKCFEYSDYVITSGFNNTSFHGGPIKDKLPVRVTFFGKKIVKLEIAQ